MDSILITMTLMEKLPVVIFVKILTNFHKHYQRTEKKQDDIYNILFDMNVFFFIGEQIDRMPIIIRSR